MSDDTLIKVSGVSKRFCRSLKKSLWYGMQDLGNELRGRRGDENGGLRQDEFWAVKDLSFELRRGESMGLIGRNGAGKTTLLRMLNGLIKPDHGRIEMRGRVGALIALGAGFNPVLTGRENIYIAGSVLGLSKQQMRRKFDDIIEFSELSEFIDAPIRSYSSGMTVRLGFAVASSLDPDILLLDEVLAVGDVGFRTKCYNRIYSLAKGSAVIFVSHNMQQVERACSTTLLMESGNRTYYGNTAHAIDLYNQSFEHLGGNCQIAPNVHFSDFCINDFPPDETRIIHGLAAFKVTFNAAFPKTAKKLEVVLSFLQPSYDLIAQISSRHSVKSLLNTGEMRQFAITIPELRLGSGKKLISLSILDAETHHIFLWFHAAWQVVIHHDLFIASPTLFPGEITMRSLES